MHFDCVWEARISLLFIDLNHNNAVKLLCKITVQVLRPTHQLAEISEFVGEIKYAIMAYFFNQINRVGTNHTFLCN